MIIRYFKKAAIPAVIGSAILMAAAMPGSLSAQEIIVTDPDYIPEEAITESNETEYETEPLIETEAVPEIPAGITDNLKKDTPSGMAAKMSDAERSAFLEDIAEANGPEKLWKRHDDISASFSLYDEESQMWKEYSVTYNEQDLYYSDDWTPGLEELRLLIRGENSCVEDYTSSMRFVSFLNVSGVPYRCPDSDPVTVDTDISEELMLAYYKTPDAVIAVTQLNESSVSRLELEEPQKEGFYSCTYLLDPSSLEVQVIRISLHSPGGHTTDRRNISYSYDHGMSPFVETGYRGLLRHMEPESVWDEEDLRTVTVTCDPGSADEKTYSITVLKGDPVAITLPEDYVLYSDESLTVRWVDNGDYVSDLSLSAIQTR